MLDCNAVAGRQRKFIIGLCVITEIEGTVSFLPKSKKVTYISHMWSFMIFTVHQNNFKIIRRAQRSGYVVGMG